MTQQNTAFNVATPDIPSIFTIFGVTGDLAAKKILPSLWYMRKEGRLPKTFAAIGYGRRELSHEDFAQLVRTAVEKFEKSSVSNEEFDAFLNLFTYQIGTFDDDHGFIELAARIHKLEDAWGICANKLFYLAVPAENYENIFTHLANVELNLPCGDDLGWSRILIEKPFGRDLESAQTIQKLLSRYFKEEQIYRIDHYLFKEIVQGIENFRFSNNLFEKTWDKNNIERIDMRLHESIGVESRGSFYDNVGALRDVGQNHLLAMLAAITMEYSASMNTECVRKNRTDILSTLKTWTDEIIARETYRAQYEGYRDIVGVAPSSTTETYFALKTELENPRWAGVPIYMEAGKRMHEARKEIVLTLKHPQPCELCETGEHGANRIVFRLEPNDEIVIHFWTKKPGFEHSLEERTISFFLYEKRTKVQYVEEYSKVLHSAIQGEQSFFVAADEIEALWKFVDPITNAWTRNIVPLATYPADTTPLPALLSIPHLTETTTPPKGTVGMVGLGKMGANLARQMHAKNWHIVGYNNTPEQVKEIESEGITGAYTLPELVQALPTPRTVWLMVPHQAVDGVLSELVPLLQKGDTIIDGGNSPYKESIRRHHELREHDINFLDVGTSGGPGGAKDGACVMVGGERAVYEQHEQLFADISVANGYAYVGGAGAGHFVKMIHNGIEYGMMQAIGEGFEILKKSPIGIDVTSTAELYNHGSVIESSLMGWLSSAYEKFGPNLDNDEFCSPSVAHSGEGQWTVDEAHELGVPAAIIEESLEFRKRSKESPSYTGRVLSALRNQFGGHTTK